MSSSASRNRCLLLGMLLAVMLSACSTTVKYGIPPKIDQLSTLKTGVSTHADVLMALGEPRGRGATRFSQASAQKFGFADYHTIWFYEFAQSDGKKVDLKFLLIFVDQEHYNGHLWFASSGLMEREN